MTETAPERVWMMPDFAAGLADQPQYIHTAEYVRADLLIEAVKALEECAEAFELHAQMYPAMVKGYTLDAQTNARATLAKLRSKTDATS